MKFNIEGITEQSGIYAGKEGYDIQVKNNTRLKGAVILIYMIYVFSKEPS